MMMVGQLRSGRLKVEPVACLQDNYAYIVWTEGGSDAVIIDASAAAPVRSALRNLRLRPCAILSTHHHSDHTGGNLSLAEEFSLPIYASQVDRDRVPGCSVALEDGGQFAAAGIGFSVLHLRGHTQGALVYLTDNICFTGDTLFCGGCGRLKEGTADELFGSLERLKQLLGPETICYTGHEYTEANLRFARRIEPDNVELRRRLERVALARRRGEFAAAARFDLELGTNPFLRTGEPAVAQGAGLKRGAPQVSVFSRLRELKDIA